MSLQEIESSHTPFQQFRNATLGLIPTLSSVLGICSQTAQHVYHSLIVAPFTRLYRQGPSFYGFGFWRGASDQDICAALTKVEATFWQRNADRCARLIRDDVASYIVLVETVLYFYLLFCTVRLCVWLCARASRRVAERRGWIERYSPTVAHWLEKTFGKQQRATNLSSDVDPTIDAADDDSPYRVYDKPLQRRRQRREKS